MTRAAVLIAGAIGLLLVARAAMFYSGVDPLAHSLVLLIGLGLTLGLVELLLRATVAAKLARSLDALSESAERSAIEKAPLPLRSLLVARLSGTPAGIGSAVFTPYLLGLLVMLGLLGTFMGLFETLRGAREALTASGDVTALREGLAAPMRGLSRAFGTSAAGVSASAMLGLAAVFVRRAEGRFMSKVSTLMTGPWFRLTLAGRQLAALETLAEDRRALPEAAKAIESASLRLESLEEKLAAQQKDLSVEASTAFRNAATEIRADIVKGIDSAAQAVAPLLQSAVQGMSDSTKSELTAWTVRLDADADARRSQEEKHRDALLEAALHSGESLTALATRTLDSLASDQKRALDLMTARITETVASTSADQKVVLATLTALATEAVSATFDEQKRAVEAMTKLTSESVTSSATDQKRAVEAMTALVTESVSSSSAAEERAVLAMTKLVTESMASSSAAEERAVLAMTKLTTDSVSASAAAQQRAIEAMTDQITASIASMSAEQQAALGAMTDLATETVAATSGDHQRAMEALASLGDRSVASLATLSRENLSAMSAHANGRAESMTAMAREHLDSMSALSERGIEAMTARVDRLSSADQERAEAMSAMLIAMDHKLSLHLTTLGESLSGPLSEAAKATQAGPEAVVRLVEAERDRLAVRETVELARDQRLDALLSNLDAVWKALSSRSDEQASRIADLDSELGRERDRAAVALSEKLSEHAAGIGESLRTTADLVREAAQLVHAGGAEMTAVADLFSGAVDRYRGASDRWLDSLSTIEAAVERKGGNEAVDLLGAYLDQTREVFDHSLAFQRELFSELRALRARNGE